MIYLDNAATSYPKPPCVAQAMMSALQRGGNPGRGGHRMSIEAAEEVYRCRQSAATLFHLSDPSRVVFTQNCTASLNIALKSVMAFGGRVIVSDMEHNSVIRPLHAISPRVPAYDVARVGESDEETVDNFCRCIRRETVAIACLHASNVFGNVLPIAKLGALAREHGLLFIVDAAQSAGTLPIDMQAMHIDLLCAPGHKGLNGPTGTGLLLCSDRYTPRPLMQGGSGSNSLSPLSPEELPERLESGTVNTVGIAGLRAAIDWTARQDHDAMYQTEMERLCHVYDRLLQIPSCRLYTPRPRAGEAVPLLSFNLLGKTPEETAALLDQAGIAVRAGLHCAPMAHRHFGTLPSGTVRIAPSVWTKSAELEKFLQILYKLS